MLEHLTRNIQAQILRIDHAAHKAEAVRQQIGTVFHDHHAGGIELQTLLEILRIEVIRGLRRDIEQRLIRHRTLDVRVDDRNRIFKIIELLFVEAVVFLVRDLRLFLLPDRHHRVQRPVLLHGLIFRMLAVRRALLDLRGVHHHLDRIPDIVGVFAHERLDVPRL